MKTFATINLYRIGFVLCALVLSSGALYGQNSNNKRPGASPTPLVRKTSSSKPISAKPKAKPLAIRYTPFPVLADVYIPGTSGILIENLNGRVVFESYSNRAFNPASNVKVATSYAVLKAFTPNYRFRTRVWTDGKIDRYTRTLTGNLYVSGRDPVFAYEHAVLIANELNRLGISEVTGDLIVTGNFAMNRSTSSQRSVKLLKRTLNLAERSRSAAKAWNNFVAGRKSRRSTVAIAPSILITGATIVSVLPRNAKLLFTHESTPLREIVKAMMSYSNNFLAERLGFMVGGPQGVSHIVRTDTNVGAAQFRLASCSGLGINRVTPRAHMKLLRAFRQMLGRNNMQFSDVLPVAGMDVGTLRNRFKTGLALGSVVGKTGTLNQTDRGVSTLSGEITTRKGKLLFVIFNQRGGVRGFRSFQNSIVPLVQNQFGGAKTSGYRPIPMTQRLSKSRVVYPNGNAR